MQEYKMNELIRDIFEWLTWIFAFIALLLILEIFLTYQQSLNQLTG